MNTYDVNQGVRCRALFTDPATATVLTATARAGTTTLPVDSGIAGGGFPTGSAVAVGDEVATVAAPGASSTGIPLTAPLTRDHPPGEPVGLLVDPTNVIFKVKGPAGAITTSGPGAPVVKDGVGQYHLDVTATSTGTWYYRAEGSGAWPAAVESAFRAGASAFS